MSKGAAHSLYGNPVTVGEVKVAKRSIRGRVVVIDDDVEILAALAALLALENYSCETYASALAYLEVHGKQYPGNFVPSCVLCDVKMPEVDGLELQSRLSALDDTPLLLMSGVSGAPEAVSAFRAGALDFLIKPLDADILLNAVLKALAVSAERQRLKERKLNLAGRIATLTKRELEIARKVALGQTNPSIAQELGIALRTVKLYRQRAMEKMGAKVTADLVRLADEGGLS